MKLLFKALTRTGPKEFKWVKGLPTYDYEKTCKITGIDTGKEYYPIAPETLCQASGRLDKNGKEVFDKDRLKFIHKAGKQTIEEELTVYYDENSTQFTIGKKGCLLPLHMYKTEEAEILGNENDDLYLEVTKKRRKKEN